MVYFGHVKNGMVVFDPPISLPEGLEVAVDIPERAVEARIDRESAPSPGPTLLKYSGKAVGLPEDAARNHDHYLYGTPKR
jgi:hypothetical protein